MQISPSNNRRAPGLTCRTVQMDLCVCITSAKMIEVARCYCQRSEATVIVSNVVQGEPQRLEILRGGKITLLGSSLVAALAMRNAVAEGKAGAAACFSEMSKVASCKPFFSEENPKAEGLLHFPGWWFGVFSPLSFSLKNLKPYQTQRYSNYNFFQAVSQRDKEKEEVPGKKPCLIPCSTPPDNIDFDPSATATLSGMFLLSPVQN